MVLHHVAIAQPVIAAWVTAARGQDVGVERGWFDRLNAQHAREQANCTKAETLDLRNAFTSGGRICTILCNHRSFEPWLLRVLLRQKVHANDRWMDLYRRFAPGHCCRAYR